MKEHYERRAALNLMSGRDLGLKFEGGTSLYNAITDIPGVAVGYSTIITGMFS